MSREGESWVSIESKRFDAFVVSFVEMAMAMVMIRGILKKKETKKLEKRSTKRK